LSLRIWSVGTNRIDDGGAGDGGIYEKDIVLEVER